MTLNKRTLLSIMSDLDSFKIKVSGGQLKLHLLRCHQRIQPSAYMINLDNYLFISADV